VTDLAIGAASAPPGKAALLWRARPKLTVGGFVGPPDSDFLVDGRVRELGASTRVRYSPRARRAQ
jgi:hypothetical protein